MLLYMHFNYMELLNSDRSIRWYDIYYFYSSLSDRLEDSATDLPDILLLHVKSSVWSLIQYIIHE